jgi:hypothetical protein
VKASPPPCFIERAINIPTVSGIGLSREWLRRRQFDAAEPTRPKGKAEL